MSNMRVWPLLISGQLSDTTDEAHEEEIDLGSAGGLRCMARVALTHLPPLRASTQDICAEADCGVSRVLDAASASVGMQHESFAAADIRATEHRHQ